jgi:hypothetical protein
VNQHDVEALGIIATHLLVSAALTWTFARFAGRRLAGRSMAFARLASVVFAPAAYLTIGTILFRIDLANHPGSDWPAMQLLGWITAAGMALVTSIPVSHLVLRRSERHMKERP